MLTCSPPIEDRFLPQTLTAAGTLRAAWAAAIGLSAVAAAYAVHGGDSSHLGWVQSLLHCWWQGSCAFCALVLLQGPGARNHAAAVLDCAGLWPAYGSRY
jgi:hypothetical protein